MPPRPNDHPEVPRGRRRKHGHPADRPAKPESAGGNRTPSHARSPRGGKPAGPKDEQNVPPVSEWYAPHRC